MDKSLVNVHPKGDSFLAMVQWCILIESKREEQRIESCTLPRNALSFKGATSGTKEGGASDRCRGRAHVGKLCSEASDVLTRMGGCRGNSVVNLEEAISGSGEEQLSCPN